MDYCKIIIFVFLTTLIVCGFFTAPNLEVTPLMEVKLGGFIGLKRPYSNLSPLPSPSPSPVPAPVHHVHLHSHSHSSHPRRSHHQYPPSAGGDGDGGRRKKVQVAVLVSAAAMATCIICLIGIFFGCRKLRKQTKNKSSSKHVKKVISDPVSDRFYHESVFSLKQDSDDNDQNFTSQTNQLGGGGEERDLRLSNSEIMDNVVIESLKFDEEDEQVFFGSPIGEEIVHHSSSDDDESFHSFCNPRISDASSIAIGCETLQPPPPPPPPRPCSFPTTKTIPLPPPPPPPSQSIPTGKDGSPLPKLKPLHWDKVRAAPDRSMVWDKLRSSSFE